MNVTVTAFDKAKAAERGSPEWQSRVGRSMPPPVRAAAVRPKSVAASNDPPRPTAIAAIWYVLDPDELSGKRRAMPSP